MSVTRLHVERDPRGGRVRVVVRTDGPRGRGHLAVRVLDARPDGARVALLAEGALLLADDDIGLDLVIGSGVRLDVVEPAGTVAYDMRGGRARWVVTAEVAPDGRLVWRAEPFVVSTGADVSRSLDLHLRERAVAVLRETVVLGRSAEVGGRLRQRLRVTGPTGTVLVEDLDLDGAAPRPGVLAGSRVVDTVSVLGRRAGGIPTPPGAHRLELDAEGTMLRSLVTAVHLSGLEPAWAAAAAADEAALSEGVRRRRRGAARTG